MERLLFNFHDVVLLLTTYQCTLFAGLLLFLRPRTRVASLFLAGFLLTQAAIPLDILITYGAGFRDWAIGQSTALFHSFSLAYWLEGPLLLWYTRALIYRDFSLRPLDGLFLLPFGGIVVWEYLQYYRLDEAARLALLSQDDVLAEPLVTHVIGFAREALRTAFGIACLLEVRRARRRIRDLHSSVERIDFLWLYLLVVGYLVLRIWAILVSVGIILAAHAGLPLINFENLGLAANYTNCLLVSILIFFSLSHGSIFEGLERHAAPAAGPEETRPEIDPEYIERLEAMMEREKPFLANVLTLEQLAGRLDIPKRALSGIINRHYEKNFFEFINHYRVAEARRLLADPAMRDRTITEIMGAAGFNSKATFNTFFKKIEGQTPSQYRKRLSH